MGQNAYVKLKIKEEGTFLALFPPRDGGQQLMPEDVLDYLNMMFNGKYEQGIVREELNHTISNPREVLVSLEKLRPPIDEQVIVRISHDNMKATGIFFPPAEGGAKMTKDDIVQALIKSGVKYGVCDDQIMEFFKDRKYCTSYTLAKATPQEEGSDAEIIYYFNTNLKQKPRVNEDGSVDFHHLDMISSVNRGDLLAELHPAVMGKPGIDVRGGLLRPVKVKQKVLRVGKNIKLSEDNLKCYSDVNGHAMIEGEQIFVSDQYEVAANVDTSTGDIEYEGNVLVHGNVATGYVVKAKGDVIVEGVVEGAYIEAGGQIVLKRGIQGMEKGVLKAGSNVISKFIESATVESGGYVTANSIMHSKIVARGDITVEGKKGFISGGTINSTTMVTARTIGSTMGTTTVVEVGIDPKVLNEYHNLSKELADNLEQQEQLKLSLTALAKRLKLGEKVQIEKALQFKREKKTLDDLVNRVPYINDRMAELKERIDSYDGGCIRVLGNVYPGCKFVVSNAVYYVKSEMSYCRFDKEEGEVRCNSYY